MTRFFYTDPLAASWMAKHFGMEFTLPVSCPHPWNTPGHKVHWSALAEMDCGWFGLHNAAGNGITPLRFCEEVKPLFVHPDSLPLLVTQVGDTVQSKFHGPIEVSALSEYQGAPLIEGKADCYGEGTSFRPEEIDLILRRNGVAFMWPEQEAV